MKQNKIRIVGIMRYRLKLIWTIALFLVTGLLLAQQNNDMIIRGKVVDAATNQAIAAAQISVPDKNVSAVTDDQGNFEIKIVSPLDILHVKAIGYSKTEVSLRGRKSVKISLYREGFTSYFKEVDGLVFPAEQSAATASLSVGNSTDMTTSMIADDHILKSVSGNVRTISRSGLTGMGAAMFIRGINSISANAQPLFVIDGVIWNNFQEISSIHDGYFSNPLDNIEVNDIENITVLKDGTSVYGSKGSNGVIIINTKRAKSMVTKINLNVMAGTTEAPGAVPMLNGEQFRIYANDMLNSGGLDASYLSGISFLNADPSSVDYKTAHNLTDWNSLVYQQGLTQNYTINVTGGDEKALYYFSLGLGDYQGVVKTTDWQRINARFNADFKLFNVIDLMMNIGFTRNERKLMDDGMNFYSSPTFIAKLKTPFLSQFTYSNQGELTKNIAPADYFNMGNPVGLIDHSLNFAKKYRFNITANPGYQINKYLRIESLFDYSLYKTIEGHFVPMTYTATMFMPNVGVSKNRISSQIIRNTNVYNNTKLTYDRKIDIHQHLKAEAGIRYVDNYLESDYVEEHNSGSNNNTTITGSYDFLKVTGQNYKTKSLSNYYHGDYSYDNRYFLSADLSLDASSRFGKNTGIGVFPAVNGAWIVSAENFMKNIDIINFLKIRAGYGMTGNDGIQDYESMAYFNSVRFMDRANGLVLSNIENTEVQWESTGRANLGFDMSFLNEKFSLFVDLFSSKTNNLLTMKSLPDITGLGYYWSNGGTMTNQGFEVTARLKMVNTRDFQWELGAMAGSYKNNITELPDDQKYTASVLGGQTLIAENNAVGVFYGYKSLGVFSTEADAAAADLKVLNANGTYSAFTAGDMHFNDLDGNHIIDENDRQVIGNPHPDLYGNFTSTINYKRISLNALFTYSYGNDVYNAVRKRLEAGADFANQTQAMMRRWTGEGQHTDIPKATYTDPMGNSRFSDRWIEDGSYLKFKSLSLSYDVPVKLNFVEGLKVWVSAENIALWSNYLGLDPEVTAGNAVYVQGVDAGLLPNTRSYYVGIKLNL
jgi:TonB-linked SusC/RagA family outer membrane protein